MLRRFEKVIGKHRVTILLKIHIYYLCVSYIIPME